MDEKVEFYKETESRDTEIGRIPRDWEVMKLGNVITYVKGKKPKGMTEEHQRGYLPYLSAEYLRSDKVTKFAEPSEDVILVNEGDLILLWDGSNAGEFFWGKQGILSSTMVRIEQEKPSYDQKFLFYLLKAKESVLKRKTKGTGIPHVNESVLSDLVIPDPPLVEQQKIAEILTTIDEVVRKTDDIIAKTEGLKKGLMQELLTKGIGHKEFKDTEIGGIPKDWEVKKIGDIAQTSSGGTPNRAKKEYYNGNIPWVKSSELKDNIIYDTEEKITGEGLQNSSAKILPKGTLLVAMYGATIGKTGILGMDAAMNQAICAIWPNKMFDLNFLKHYIIFGRERLVSISSGGAQPNISQEIIRAFKIPLPSLQEQQRIAEILSTVDEKLETLRQERVKLERVKQWFMEELLTGRIRVRVA